MPIIHIEEGKKRLKRLYASTRAREDCHKTGKAESEKTLEARLVREVGQQGGEAIKLLSQHHRGLPDRMVLMPGGLVYFVEMKTTGKKPTALQLRCHDRLRELGFPVCVIDSTDTLLDFIEAL